MQVSGGTFQYSGVLNDLRVVFSVLWCCRSLLGEAKGLNGVICNGTPTIHSAIVYIRLCPVSSFHVSIFSLTRHRHQQIFGYTLKEQPAESPAHIHFCMCAHCHVRFVGKFLTNTFQSHLESLLPLLLYMPVTSSPIHVSNQY